MVREREKKRSTNLPSLAAAVSMTSTGRQYDGTVGGEGGFRSWLCVNKISTITQRGNHVATEQYYLRDIRELRLRCLGRVTT